MCSQTHTLLLFELSWSHSLVRCSQTTKEKALFNLLCRSWTSLASQTKVPRVWLTQKVAASPPIPSAPFVSWPLLQRAHWKSFVVLAQRLANIPRKTQKANIKDLSVDLPAAAKTQVCLCSTGQLWMAPGERHACSPVRLSGRWSWNFIEFSHHSIFSPPPPPQPHKDVQIILTFRGKQQAKMAVIGPVTYLGNSTWPVDVGCKAVRFKTPDPQTLRKHLSGYKCIIPIIISNYRSVSFGVVNHSPGAPVAAGMLPCVCRPNHLASLSSPCWLLEFFSTQGSTCLQWQASTGHSWNSEAQHQHTRAISGSTCLGLISTKIKFCANQS